MTDPLEFDIRGLQKALRNTPSSVTIDLLSNMLESFKEQICISKCQYNRVVCILRPKCHQRHFLDLLINSGYKHSNIPQFCYSVRLKEINENYSRNIYSLTSDITIFLSDFYRIFGKNKPRFHYKRDFNKIIAFYGISNFKEVGSNIVIGLNKNLLFVNLEKELVVVNPMKWVIIDPEILLATLSILSKEYDMKLEITEQYEHSIVLTFSFPNAEESLNENQFEDAIRHSDILMSYDHETNEVFAEIHIPQQATSLSFQEFNVEKIRHIFDELNDIRPKEANSESIMEESTKKAKAKGKIKTKS